MPIGHRTGSRAQDRLPVYYTRCPVPTATGIALDNGMFDRLLAGTPYVLRDIADAGEQYANAHYTHSIDRCLREGGASPPVWARARGAETRLLGITFMEETLGIFVRDDDPAQNVRALAGRRIGLPVWRGLAFDFWRFAAQKGFQSALRRHGVDESAVTAVDIEEGVAAPARRGTSSSEGGPDERECNYRGQLEALLDGRIDAMFGKGLELAPLERRAGRRVRLLYDLATSPERSDRVNNSTPRLVTASARLVDEHGELVVRYMQALLRAARWAGTHAAKTRDIVSRQCAVDPQAVERYLNTGYAKHFAPELTSELRRSVDVLKSFLLRWGYLAGDFSIDDWIDPGPLRQAQSREYERAP
jgi:ABC-type nitrate/sulfonate/bicarbonate transport system substrate-binding protein